MFIRTRLVSLGVHLSKRQLRSFNVIQSVLVVAAKDSQINLSPSLVLQRFVSHGHYPRIVGSLRMGVYLRQPDKKMWDSYVVLYCQL